MVITAKFGSTCPRCGRAITPGAKVEWEKGQRATHVTCPVAASEQSAQSAQSAQRPKATRAPATRRKAGEGEHTISRISSGRGDAYAVGATLYLPRIDGGSGDGHWHTVVSAWVEPPDEDIGSPDWMCRAIVRPATDAEREAASAERREMQRIAARAAMTGWIVRQVRDVSHHTVDRVPADAWRLVVGARIAGSETLYVTEDAVWYVASNYDDGPTRWRLPLTREMVSAVAEMVEALS